MILCLASMMIPYTLADCVSTIQMGILITDVTTLPFLMVSEWFLNSFGLGLHIVRQREVSFFRFEISMFSSDDIDNANNNKQITKKNKIDISMMSLGIHMNCVSAASRPWKSYTIRPRDLRKLF
jgi:hypothetical protein